MGCAYRSCAGRFAYPRIGDLLGYSAGDGISSSGGPLDAGNLVTADGFVAFNHALPYDAHDAVGSEWRPGDTISILASGAAVPLFSVDVPFPPRVSFLQPDLGAGSVVLDSDTLDLKWTPVAGAGTVDVTIATLFQPDAGYSTTVYRCSAPVTDGEMVVPIPSGRTRPASPQSWFGLAVRVLNRGTSQVAGLTVEALVASFDSGIIVDAPPGASADSGTVDGP
jgi:hypothetical protein